MKVPRNIRLPQHHGFTLIELMVTIAVMAILASLAAPALGTFVSRNTIRALSNDFNQGLQRTRSEAINRNECVVMCMSSTTGNALPTCATGGSDWRVGWIAFRHPSCTPNSSGNYTGFSAEDIFLRREGVDVRYALVSASADRSVIFNSRGVSRLNNAGQFNLQDTLAPASDAKFARTFCLDGVGRVRVLEFAGTC